MASSFDLDTFRRTDSVALFRGAMLEPINDCTIPVPRDVLARLMDELFTFDAAHMVYAMELCSIRCPAALVKHLPSLLLHPDSSVKAAAARSLLRLPHGSVDRQLISRTQESIAQLDAQFQAALKDIPEKLELLLANGPDKGEGS